MKILGVGIDLVTHSKISQIMSKKYAQRFIRKFLHQKQLLNYSQIKKQNEKIEFIASRWAVKQALSKALGRKQLVFHEIEIVKDNIGRPQVQFEGDQNNRLLFELQVYRCHISLTHEKDYALGTAIVQCYI